jgi:hypothetical protein|tara:strand:- start:2573 stop:2809 length:237 start_codon:yes stop_codon:yes gene_type:complete
MEIIRKIIVGNDPLKAMAYYVGQKAGAGEVNAILLDRKHLDRYKERRYVIYIKDNNGDLALWKAIENAPVLLEFDCNF